MGIIQKFQNAFQGSKAIDVVNRAGDFLLNAKEKQAKNQQHNMIFFIIEPPLKISVRLQKNFYAHEFSFHEYLILKIQFLY